MPIARPIGEPELAGIEALPDPVLRNLWITTAYHDLAMGMARLVGPRDLSWPAFATWASKTAGASIRGEEIPGLVRAVLDRSWPYRRVIALIRGYVVPAHADDEVGLLAALDEAVAAVSVEIARGNLLVFQELGPLFARMVSVFTGPAAPHAERRAAVLATVRAVDGDPDATERLRTVFAHYCDAMVEPDPVLKAQRILLANALVGLTEQIRLQPNIQGALDAPIDTSLGEWVDRTLAVLPAVARLAAEPVIGLLADEIKDVWRRCATEHLMKLAMPGGDVLNLGRDVPPPEGGPLFPDDLRQIREADLAALLGQYDRTDGSGRGSGADDWADLAQRMTYILTLFRSRQQAGSLLLPPFAPAQWAVMEMGQVPAGGL